MQSGERPLDQRFSSLAQIFCPVLGEADLEDHLQKPLGHPFPTVTAASFDQLAQSLNILQ
jgi:hypothetical protein